LRLELGLPLLTTGPAAEGLYERAINAASGRRSVLASRSTHARVAELEVSGKGDVVGALLLGQLGEALEASTIRQRGEEEKQCREVL
jgi:hypothetical protein